MVSFIYIYMPSPINPHTQYPSTSRNIYPMCAASTVFFQLIHPIISCNVHQQVWTKPVCSTLQLQQCTVITKNECFLHKSFNKNIPVPPPKKKNIFIYPFRHILSKLRKLIKRTKINIHSITFISHQLMYMSSPYKSTRFTKQKNTVTETS